MNDKMSAKSATVATRPWYERIATGLSEENRNRIWDDWTEQLDGKPVFKLSDFRRVVAQHHPGWSRKTLELRTQALVAYFVHQPSDLKRNADGGGYVWREPGELEQLLAQCRGETSE